MSNHPYINFDDSLDNSVAHDLFLSYYPESKQFKPDNAGGMYAGQDGMIPVAQGVTHADVLKHPYAWMRDNQQHVI